jgi:5,5'-dehydrodivanillate O-demethylase
MAWVTQGPIADRTREMLGASDSGIALYRRLLLEQAARVRAGEDPLGTIRDERENRVIELPHERNKYGAGAPFLLRSIEDGHARHSPLKDLVREMVQRASR